MRLGRAAPNKVIKKAVTREPPTYCSHLLVTNSTMNNNMIDIHWRFYPFMMINCIVTQSRSKC